MDPDENVREQNRIVLKMRAGEDFDNERLLELRAALREWLRGGGFRPQEAAI